MIYFFILPVFAIYLGLSIIALIVTLLAPRWKPMSRYLFVGALGSVIGFVVCNALVYVVTIPPSAILSNFELTEVRKIVGVFLAIILLVAPIPASLIGTLAGFLGGLFITHKARGSMR